MKILVIGGVAAGTKAAARIRRLDPAASVTILTKSSDISRAACALPYYVGGVVADKAALTINTPARLKGLTGVEARTETTVTKIDPTSKTVTAVKNGESMTESYDKLVIATGAEPVIPDIEGVNLPGVYCVRTAEDAIGMRDYIADNKCRSAVVVGAGFAGLEMSENLRAQGLTVTVIELAAHIMPGALDGEMADYAAKTLRRAGVRIMTGVPCAAITGALKADGVMAGGIRTSADLVVLAIGTRPATAFLEGSGIEMSNGAVIVNDKMETNIPDIYAAGDCAMIRNRQTGKPARSRMGSTANITGRILADNLAGGHASYAGSLATGICRLDNGLVVGRTGMTEEAANGEGLHIVSTMCMADEKPSFYPGAAHVFIKLIAEKQSEKILGVQVIGSDSVDKIIDIAAVAVSKGMTIREFNDLDLCYAPPFSTAIHPLTQACMVLENKIDGLMASITPAEYLKGAAKGYTIVDLLPTPAISGAKVITLETLEGPIADIPTTEKLLLVCNRGRRAYLAQTRLRAYGYTDTLVLEGGVLFNTVKVPTAGKLSPEDIKRVKGLGCLVDKRYGDRFNMRVITRNGKLTSDEQRAVAECAEKYGSGEVTMTTRLTLEIQCIPYDKIDEAIEFLKGYGLETGGTGSLVRPVVSCKGTTCQYGLCDTFDLSTKLHEVYYKGWHTVTLPHKFKLAVGGCPNNCVKPSLNDLGIIGQRVPQIDMDKCRGCKVCQIETACPIKIAHVENGKISVDPDKCNHCGRCVGKCPFHAMDESTYGYKVYIGGRWGKRVREGQPLSRIFTSQDEIMELVEKALLLFRDEGITGERFSDTIERLGFDYVEDKLLNGTIDREAVLNKTVIGGAKC